VRRGFVVLCLGALACSEPTPPSRGGTYNFADTIPPDTIITFHWPSTRLPVRYYAAPQGNLPFLVQRAVATWAGLFLYDEFTGTLVSDSVTADVIVVWTDSVPPDAPPDTAGSQGACNGETDPPTVDSTSTFTGPFRIKLSVLTAAVYTPGQVQACMRRTAIHEVGHSLGLFLHSPAPGDIMHSPPLVEGPSEQDRRTVERLYHTPATILPAPP